MHKSSSKGDRQIYCENPSKNPDLNVEKLAKKMEVFEKTLNHVLKI